ncbi:hypothetical protein [Caedibacter taeniospiralis]|jgi:predicted nucleic acid-binding protein|uniref:hypothetical protein n=1 Tax=Caedibacter taeniospiralis TaxID=28907 RepID=UPI0037BFBC7F
MSQARKKGLAIGMADGYIGAIAKTHSLTIATRDTSPFAAMEIQFINPWLP